MLLVIVINIRRTLQPERNDTHLSVNESYYPKLRIRKSRCLIKGYPNKAAYSTRVFRVSMSTINPFPSDNEQKMKIKRFQAFHARAINNDGSVTREMPQDTSRKEMKRIRFEDNRVCFASDTCNETLFIKTNDPRRDKKNES